MTKTQGVSPFCEEIRALLVGSNFGIGSRVIKSCYWFSLAFLAVALVSGCKPSGHALPEPPRVADGEPGRPGGRLVLAALSPRTFNPLLNGDSGSDAAIRLLFSSLVELDMESQEAKPGLAESWTVAPDQKTWTFKLRKNLRWSDGQPLTADDVVFTWNQVMYNPKYNQLTYDLFRSNGKNFEVTKVDDLTVRVVTPEIFAPFVEYFGSVFILPQHKLKAWAAGGNFLQAYAVTNKPENIVGSGPFRLRSYDSQKSVVLERNPEFWMVDKRGRRLPYLDEVELRIPKSTIDEAMFLSGECAAFENIRADQAWQFQAVANGKFRFVDLGAGVQRDFLWFNLKPGTDRNGKPFVDPVKLKWFGDKRFREAISCGLNRERLIHDAYAGRAVAVYGFISAENKRWNDPSVPQYTYNPNQARALLAEMGMTNHTPDGMLEDAEGHPVRFTLVSSMENPIRQAVAVRVGDDLKQLGIRVDYQPLSTRTLNSLINISMNYECASMGFGGGGIDPASQLNVLKSDAPLHQWNPLQPAPATDWERRMDTLMDAQMRTLDFAQRKKYFDEVQAIWADEMPMISIAAPSTGAAIRSDIGNVRPAVAGGYHVTWNIEELYFKK
jgi:peptide/nickel transport system substrate-binding protein